MTFNARPLRWILILLAGSLALIIIPQIGTRDPGRTGEELAHTYCASCHPFTEPALLDKNTWVQSVLPEMGLRMGMGDRNTVLNRMSFQLFDKLCNLGIYPASPAITLKEWKRIVAYFEKNAPDSLEKVERIHLSPTTKNPFRIRSLPSIDQAQLSLVRFVPKQKQIWTFDRNGQWNRFNLGFQKLSTEPTRGPVVDAMTDAEPVLLSIGNMLPNEDRKGSLARKNAKGTRTEKILDSLHRPVQACHLDMDGDGIRDWLVAEFGFETGQLRWFSGKDRHPHMLSASPGARNIVATDADRDGDTDLLVLFAQASEEVVLFRNEGAGNYARATLLSFPPVHGSSWLEWADMDGDGLEDIILANGDNADYSIIPKPYHGIRIFRNDGRMSFRQTYFHPVNGATKVLARDFDGDGDSDMTMIAFFATDKKLQSFLYFENDGKGGFRVSNLGVPAGDWLLMEADDMDQDGDQDLILGNFLMSGDPKKNPSGTSACLILENLTGHGPR